MVEFRKIKSVEVSENSTDLETTFNMEERKSEKLRKRSFWVSFRSLNLRKIGLIILFFIVLTAFMFGIGFYKIYLNAKSLESSLQKLNQALDEKDLVKIKGELKDVKNTLIETQKVFKYVGWLKFLPLVGTYVSDASHIINAGIYGVETTDLLVETVSPYAYIIGFKNAQGEVPDRKSTYDTIGFIIESLPDLISKSGVISTKVSLLKQEVDYIDPARYPEKMFGLPIRDRIEKGKELVELGSNFVIRGKPLLEVIPYLLGLDSERRYLLIFQNDKELRPTGGFITAYSIAKVKNGIIEPISSNDIYNLDNLYKPKVEAPEVLRKYIKGPYLISKNYRLRDMNWSPDFFESMQLFTREAASAGIKNIDGVIAVDTFTLVNILDVLGEIQVPGYGGYSNNIVELCNCPQVVYELESFADLEGPIVWSENEPGKIVYAPPNFDNRKKIIGPMMNTILKDTLGLPTSKLPALFNALLRSIFEKHILIFMFDEKVQHALESFGIAGRINDYDGDFLMINDANLGGRKSNLYVTQEVNQEVEIREDGSVVKVLSIIYKNPMRHDGWLNSVLPNWVRIYVPKGSKLLSLEGLQEKKDPYEEFGKTVFSGFFELRPQGIVEVKVKYELPQKFDQVYKIYIQKQPGRDSPLYSLTLGKKMQEFYLKTDKEIKVKI